jgi:hypothetical protein
MSRHHMLPPIVYTPQPKPKKIQSRKSRVQSRSAAAVKNAADVEDTEETRETSAPRQAAPASGHSALQNFVPIEGAEQKTRSTTGRLSEGTLKTMLLAQEQEN